MHASEIISFTTRLARPQEFKIEERSLPTQSVILSWQAVDAADTYRVGMLNRLDTGNSVENVDDVTMDSKGLVKENLIGIGTYASNVTQVTLYSRRVLCVTTAFFPSSATCVS